MFRIITMVLVSTAVIAIAAAAPADAARKPTKREARSLARKMGNGVPTRCLRIRISTVSERWAGVRFRLDKRSCDRWNADGIGIYKRRRPSRPGPWRFVTAGSSFDCPVPKVPSRVARDLRVPCEPEPPAAAGAAR